MPISLVKVNSAAPGGDVGNTLVPNMSGPPKTSRCVMIENSEDACTSSVAKGKIFAQVSGSSHKGAETSKPSVELGDATGGTASSILCWNASYCESLSRGLHYVIVAVGVRSSTPAAFCIFVLHARYSNLILSDSKSRRLAVIFRYAHHFHT